MKKRVTLLMLVVLAMLAAATPALAAGPRHQNRHENQNRNQTGEQLGTLSGKQAFSLTGSITAIAADSITLLVHNGNRLAKPYAGQELLVLVTDDTRYWRWTPTGYIPIGFADVQVGDASSVWGTLSDGTFTALRVTIDVPCCTP